MTYSQAAALINVAILPSFTRIVLTEILATFDSSFDGLIDSAGAPTDGGIDTLMPLVGSATDPALKTKTWIAAAFVINECRQILGLPVVPNNFPY
jgi:hypothetical protein